MFVCSLCDKTFKSAESLGGHISGHVRRGELQKHVIEKTWTCDVCGEKAENGKELRKHKVIHKNIEDYAKDSSRKSLLIKLRGKKCEVCFQTRWCGKEIPIELDHIDGDPENSKSENLRLICPNCHAQTATYKGKNMGKVKNTKRSGVMKRYVGLYR
jgi:DNA-directed RNA polymerase subunit M/transcription elongation factor TFIIS